MLPPRSCRRRARQRQAGHADAWRVGDREVEAPRAVRAVVLPRRDGQVAADVEIDVLDAHVDASERGVTPGDSRDVAASRHLGVRVEKGST